MWRTMAPKARKEAVDLPKKMQELKEHMEANNGGRQITAADIKTADSKLRNKACNAMVHSLSEMQKAVYRRCAKDTDRHEWIKEYILDPNKVKHEGVNTIRRESASSSTSKWIWLTIDELGGSRYLNNPEHAKIAAKSLDSRPHENVGLGTAGVLQYHYNTKEASDTKSITEAAELAQKTDITATDAAELRDHMANSGNPGEEPPKKKPKKLLEIKDKHGEDKSDLAMTPEASAHGGALSF